MTRETDSLYRERISLVVAILLLVSGLIATWVGKQESVAAAAPSVNTIVGETGTVTATTT